MKHTELQEGIVVRCIQRVDELLKNIRLAAKNLESKEFEEKLERASRLIRRDIVFAPSLYTTQEVVSVYEEELAKEKPTELDLKIKAATELATQLDNIPEIGDNGEIVDEDVDEDEDDDLFKYNFEANELDSEAFNEEEQFNANFIWVRMLPLGPDFKLTNNICHLYFKLSRTCIVCLKNYICLILCLHKGVT